MYPSHEKDVYGWAIHTAQLIKDKKIAEVDFDGIVKELEEIRGSLKYAFRDRLAQLIFYLLKWQYQSDFRGRTGCGTIKEQRIKLDDLLEDNLSIKSLVEESIEKAYKITLALIEKETLIDLTSLPENCSYSFEQITNNKFFPE